MGGGGRQYPYFIAGEIRLRGVVPLAPSHTARRPDLDSWVADGSGPFLRVFLGGDGGNWWQVLLQGRCPEYSPRPLSSASSSRPADRNSRGACRVAWIPPPPPPSLPQPPARHNWKDMGYSRLLSDPRPPPLKNGLRKPTPGVLKDLTEGGVKHCAGSGVKSLTPRLSLLLPRFWNPGAEDHLVRGGLGGLPGHQELRGQGGGPHLHPGLRQHHLPGQSGTSKRESTPLPPLLPAPPGLPFPTTHPLGAMPAFRGSVLGRPGPQSVTRGWEMEEVGVGG